MKAKNLIKNFSYTIGSNMLSLIVSTLVILVLPKILGVKEYGYWQLYLFFTTYVGIFHFGWADGVYLKYGGKLYKDLDYKKFHTQFILFTSVETIFAFIIIILSFLNPVSERMFVYQATAIALIMINVRQLFLYILQITNRIGSYSAITVFDRALYLSLITLFLFFKNYSFQLMIICDLVAKCTSLSLAMWECKEIVFSVSYKFVNGMKEAISNIKVGINLLIANFASFLIIGIVRYVVEVFWGIEMFGKISLTLSISNLTISFINAISVVLFPVMRRIRKENVANWYLPIRNIIMLLLFLALFLYYPIDWLLPKWLPQYASSMIYLAVLFPMCAYEGKFELLISTFFKTIRLEQSLLITNLLTLCLSSSLTILCVLYFNSLNLLMFSIIMTLGCRSSFAELYLGKKLGVKVGRRIISENLLIIDFVFGSWFIKGVAGLLMYLIGFGIYVLIYGGKIKETIIFMSLKQEGGIKYSG